MKSSEKTDSSVKELWEIVDNLADNRSPWFIISKNGKAQKPSEPTKKTTRKKSEQFEMLIFGNSITKNMRHQVHTSKEFPNTSIYFSAILSKFDRNFNSMINYMKKEVFNLCLDNQKIEFIQHSNFAVNHDLNYDFFWKDKIHISNIGLR